MNPPLIDVQKLTVAYGDPSRTILSDIDLTVDEGEFVCVLGQTGCGKSTLLRLILGAEQPTTGRILIDGNEHPRPDRARGYVPQKYSLFPDRTVVDNITFGLEVSEFNLLTRWTPRFFARRRQFRQDALDYLRKLGLRESDASKYPDELSGGMQQRVAIAQALINRPRILLMDEAFSALDPATRRETQALMRRLWKENGFTAMFVTHNTREALLLGSRVIVLAKDHADSPSRIVLDEQVPHNWRDHEDSWICRLEKASMCEVSLATPVNA
jgi:NitT/TauT family transport system ATP-binding protein